MSYLRAEEVLPKELIETIQQYIDGKAIYIPSAEKLAWGSRTDTRKYLQERNLQIYDKYRNGFQVKELAEKYSLSEKSIQRIIRNVKMGGKMDGYTYVTLRDRPDLKIISAEWFCSKWGVPKEAYLECMEAYLKGETEYGWYLCLYDEKIIAGMGVIENDFHDRKDLSPNVCAVYTEEEHRCKCIAGNLLNMVVSDMKNKGISPIYLVTDHTGFYERYGWEFLCMVQGDGEPDMTRMYIRN